MLTIKQENFCLAYFKTGNASEAYREAYDVSKMKPETINRRAHDLVYNGKIKARIEDLYKPIRDKLVASKEKTIKRLMQGQEFDIRGLYHEDGKLKQPHELDDDTAKGVVGVKYDKDTGALVEYKIIDVKGCAELIGKHLKLWVDKVELSTDPSDPIMQAIARAAGAAKGLPKPVKED